MAQRAGRYVKDHHLALLCLFLLIGGGTAWAAGLAPNSVKSKNIKDGQVKEADIGGNAVGGDEIKGISGLEFETLLLNDNVVDGAPETGDPIVIGDFSITPVCRQTPAGTFTASVVLEGGPEGMAVHSEASNGVSNPSVPPAGVATLVEVGPTANANVRSGSFGAITDNGAFFSSIAGNVTAGTKGLATGCSFSISATGD